MTLKTKRFKIIKDKAVHWIAIVSILFAAWFYGFETVTVNGHSMEPVLYPGQVCILYKAAYGLPFLNGNGYFIRWARPKKGDIIVFKDPVLNNFAVKRCAGSFSSENNSDGEELYLVEGENDFDSIDSRLYGPVHAASIFGKVIFPVYSDER